MDHLQYYGNNLSIREFSNPIDISRVQQVLEDERQFNLSLVMGENLLEDEQLEEYPSNHVSKEAEEATNSKSKFSIFNGSPKISLSKEGM